MHEFLNRLVQPEKASRTNKRLSLGENRLLFYDL